MDIFSDGDPFLGEAWLLAGVHGLGQYDGLLADGLTPEDAVAVIEEEILNQNPDNRERRLNWWM